MKTYTIEVQDKATFEWSEVYRGVWTRREVERKANAIRNRLNTNVVVSEVE